jgi:hypothetical protein
MRQHASACVSIRQHASAYISIRPHASACVSIRQPTCLGEVRLLSFSFPGDLALFVSFSSPPSPSPRRLGLSGSCPPDRMCRIITTCIRQHTPSQHTSAYVCILRQHTSAWHRSQNNNCRMLTSAGVCCQRLCSIYAL